MPFYPEIGIVYIHIPKCGGTSIEDYFRKIDGRDIPIDTAHMYNFPLVNNHSRQHCTYIELSQLIENINKYTIIASIRNPIHRIISEIFYLAKYRNTIIPGETLDDKIKTILSLSPDSLDNHILPQYLYLTDSHGLINKSIRIVRLESLKADMERYGYPNFDFHEFATNRDVMDYDRLISEETRQFIIEYYKKDCELFYPELLNSSKPINYLGTLDWTNDAPVNSKQVYTHVISLLPKTQEVKILEIKSYVGTSLIGMLQLLPNARAYAMDNWNASNNNSKEVYTLNLINSDLINKVTLLEGSNPVLLSTLLDKKEQLDLIHVNEAHECLDTHNVLILSWHLLKNGGIMIINDYLWESNGVSPKEAIDHFLQTYQGQYTILFKSYRIFIVKHGL